MKLKALQKVQDVKAIDYVEKAMLSINKKYYKCISKDAFNTFATAIEKDIICFVWKWKREITYKQFI